jgi:hypothetical protein
MFNWTKLSSELFGKIFGFLPLRFVFSKTKLVCSKWKHIKSEFNEIAMYNNPIKFILLNVVNKKIYSLLDISIFDVISNINLIPNIKELKIINSSFCRASELQELCNLSNLENLEILGNWITNDFLMIICTNMNLRTLKINGSDISSIGLQYLTQMKNLHYLDLIMCKNIDDSTLEYIGQLHQLSGLNLYECGKITDKGISHLTNLVLLEYIHLSSKMITDYGLELLSGISTLKGIRLDFLNITQKGIEYLNNLNLIYLYISLFNFTDDIINNICSIISLKILFLENAHFLPCNTMRHLTRLKNLEQLRIYHQSKFNQPHSCQKYFLSLPQLKYLSCCSDLKKSNDVLKSLPDVNTKNFVI